MTLELSARDAQATFNHTRLSDEAHSGVRVLLPML